MSIVKMKRIRLIALAEDRDALLASLLHAGCVEVNEPTETLADEGYAALLRRDTSALSQAKGQMTELKQAIDTLNRYAPQKGGMFTPRDQMAEKDLLSPEALEQAVTLARQVNAHAKAVGACSARETRLEADRLALVPWEAYGLPLEEKGTKTVSILLGTVPNTVDFEAMAGAVEEAAEAVEKGDAGAAGAVLKGYYMYYADRFTERWRQP